MRATAGNLLLLLAHASLPPGSSAAPLLPRYTADTSKPSTVPYGALLTSCTVPGTVALTFDDGPYRFTPRVLSLLERYSAKATFFVNGDNWGRGLIDDPSTPWPNLMREMVHAGHQVGSHTYHHANLNFADPETRRREMDSLSAAFDHILGGVHPTYARPPYGACDGACQGALGAMGFHVVNFDVDTKDYEHNTPEEIQVSKDIFRDAVDHPVDGRSYLVLSHDVHETTVDILVEYMLQTLNRRGYRAVTVGECMGDPAEYWYAHGDGEYSAADSYKA